MDTQTETVDANVPHTRIPLAHYAELQETIERLDDSLDKAVAKVKLYKDALTEVSALCAPTDESRAFVGDYVRNILNPPIAAKAKPGQEAK